jgi:hypothetical protein
MGCLKRTYHDETLTRVRGGKASREKNVEWVWLSVDPLAHKYPCLSSYVFTGNNPVMLVDDQRSLYAYRRQRGDSEVVAFLNFSDKSAVVDLSSIELHPNLEAYLSSGQVPWKPESKELELPKFGFMILTR